MQKQIDEVKQGKIQGFEELYILTYETLYSHAIHLMRAVPDAKKLLVETYSEIFKSRDKMPEEKRLMSWMKITMEDIAVQQMGLTNEDITIFEKQEIAYQKLTDEEATTILLRVEEILQISDESDENQGIAAIIFNVLKCILAVVAVSVAVVAINSGLKRLKYEMPKLKQPFMDTNQFIKESSGSVNGTGNSNIATQIKVGDRLVYLSNIGQVLFSDKLENTDYWDQEFGNPEIQVMGEWTYYLPIPDRDGGSLNDVNPKFFHTLFRVNRDETKMEIVSREVEDFSLWNDGIYIMQFGTVQHLDANDQYENGSGGVYPELREDGIYLLDDFGRDIQKEADGTVRRGDLIFEMSGNKISEVRQADQIVNGVAYYIKRDEKGQLTDEILADGNGEVGVLVKHGMKVDAFCIVNDWIYYSTCIRRGGSGAYYSQIYRKSLQDGTTEMVRDEFKGNIQNMYYNQETNEIYANYLPNSWKNHYGVIAVITMGGQLSILDDKEARSVEKTTGNDMLEFVMTQGDQVYCFWTDYNWKRGEEPTVIWTKPLVISSRNRTAVK